MAVTKKKAASAAAAVAMAAALALGGTFAWQSISQTALNEASDVVNPGGRLHDDFNGTNKDVYVENFADEDIFARIRLDEYFEITMNKGTAVETTELVTTGAEKGNVDTYVTHLFGEKNDTDEWWEWTTGGSTVYMPTFNMNKDSLEADVNGTYEAVETDDEGNVIKRYTDYVEYSENETAVGTEVYDFDANSADEGDSAEEGVNIKFVSEDADGNPIVHTAKKTGGASLISMDEWKDLGSPIGEYWVYDSDGWVYWAQAIEGGTATGLLLDGIEQTQVMDDSWYYAINVVGQFITADDLGKADNTGFYADDNADGVPDSAPSADAVALLKAIGVEVPITNAEELQAALNEGGEVELDGTIETDVASGVINGDNDYNVLWHEGGSFSGGTLETSGAKFGLFINNENNWPVSGDGANAAIVENVTFVGDNGAAVYTQAIDAPITLNNVTITGSKIGLYSEYTNLEDPANGVVTLNDCTITSDNQAPDDKPWQNAAVAVAKSSSENGAGHVVINSGSYTGDYAVYVYSSGGTIDIYGGYFDGKLGDDADGLTIYGGTFTDDPTEFVAEGYEAVENGDGTFAVIQSVGGSSSVNASFSTTDELSGTPYMVLTKISEGSDLYKMSFVRTEDEISAGEDSLEGSVIEYVTEVSEESGGYFYFQKYYYDWEMGVEYGYKVESIEYLNKIQPQGYLYSFYGMEHLKTVEFNGNLDISSVSDIASLFSDCSALEEIDMSYMDFEDRKVNIYGAFSNCSSLKSIKLPRNIVATNDSVSSIRTLFSGCSALETIEGLETLDVSLCDDFGFVFTNCEKLTSVDISSWDMSKVNDTTQLFMNCKSLVDLSLPADFDTSLVTSMSWMFYYCENLELDCSAWSVAGLTGECYAFNEGAPKVTPPAGLTVS